MPMIETQLQHNGFYRTKNLMMNQGLLCVWKMA